jgi:hypothetical protein
MLICVAPISAFAVEDTPEAIPEEKPITEEIVDYVKSHVEELAVLAYLFGSGIYGARSRKKMNGSIGTLNNNAISIASNSTTIVEKALARVDDIAGVVNDYGEKMATLMAEIRNSEEEKKALRDALVKVESYLSCAKLATIEMSNEVAELLCLSNIPNSKKDELYARHTKAVHELEAAEEVMNHDVTEA